MAAMHLEYTSDGEVTDKLIHFYSERARGGVGLIIVGGCRFDALGGPASFLSISDNRFIPGLKKLTQAVQQNGAQIAVQLYHAGRYTHSSSMAGAQSVSASAVRSRLTGETPRALGLEEMIRVQDLFAEAAVRAVESGFDAIEVLGSAGYLISQFLSPVTNQRQDDYGGCIENRMRFGKEVVEKIRKAVGPDYPIIMRIAGNEFMEGGNTNNEAKRFAIELEKAGVDLINVTGGWHETRIPQLTAFVPRRAYTYLARGVKSVVSLPVIASNRINDPEIAENIVRNGEADLVTMARALLADPDMPNKALHGKSHTIYHCVACNQGCLDNIFRPTGPEPVTCMVNPRAGREGEWITRPAVKAKNVLVIGGGPAGMKAACTLAERGQRVTLVEKESQLGGQLLLNRFIPGREELVSAVTDLISNLNEWNVDVRLEIDVDGPFVKKMSPDAVVIATGAAPASLDIPGIDHPKVVQAWDVLAQKVHCGRTVTVVGGNAVGLETALYLACQGTLSPEVLHFLMIHRAESLDRLTTLLDKGNKQVTVVEMEKKTGQDIGPSTRWTVLAELKRLGVDLMNRTTAVGVTDKGLEIQKDGKSRTLASDTIVLAVGSRPENSLVKELKSFVSDITLVGDAKSPRKALEAIKEGFLVGLEI